MVFILFYYSGWFKHISTNFAGEEGKRRAKRNATELATGDRCRGHGLFTTQGASTRVDKMESIENVNLLVRAEYNSSSSCTLLAHICAAFIALVYIPKIWRTSRINYIFKPGKPTCSC